MQRNQQTLRLGLAALEQGQWSQAISAFQAVLETGDNITPADRLKAQVSLASAYQKSGQMHKAAVIAQSLSTHQSPNVQAWATKMLSNLSNPPEPQPTDPIARPIDTSGFVPIEPSSEIAQQPALDRQRTRPRPAERTRSNPPHSRAIPDNLPLQQSTSTTLDTASQPPIDPNATTHRSQTDVSQRAQRWQPLAAITLLPLRLGQLATAASLWLIPAGIFFLSFMVQDFWGKFCTRVLRLSQSLPTLEIPWLALSGVLFVLFWSGPWLLDLLLKQQYGLKALSTLALSKASPEAYRLLQRGLQSMGVPQLCLLPVAVPIVFSYGFSARQARLVMSQGVFDQFDEAEIAALCALEVGHLSHQSVPILTWATVVCQGPYVLYDWGAIASNFCFQQAAVRSRPRWQAILLFLPAYSCALVSAIAYGLFRSLRLATFWLSRTRSGYSDRTACNLTGHPNGLAAVLLALTTATQTALCDHPHEALLLERLEWLLPLGRDQAVRSPDLALLSWDCNYLDRHWLNANQTHVLLGERLLGWMQIAQSWKIAPLYDPIELQVRTSRSSRRQSFLRASAPFTGAAIGYGLAIVAWSTAWIAYTFGQMRWAWLGSDYGLLSGLPLLGFGLGLIARFNWFFPDLPPNLARKALNPSDPEAAIDLANTLQQSSDLDRSALRPQAIVICNSLMGVTGVHNWLGQHLWIPATTGWIKLHYCTTLGPVSNWLRGEMRPSTLIGQTVGAIGWLRQGAVPWIDLETLRTAKGRNVGDHAVWSILTATLSILLSLYLML